MVAAGFSLRRHRLESLCHQSSLSPKEEMVKYLKTPEDQYALPLEVRRRTARLIVVPARW